MDETAAQRNANQLEGLVEETSALSNELKVRIKTLQKKGGSGRDGQIRKQQVCLTVCTEDTLLDSMIHNADGFSEAEIRRSHSELSTGGTAVPFQV